MRRLLFFLSLLCLVIIAGAASYSFYAYRSYVDANGPSSDETILVLPRGAGLGEIVSLLDEAGVIDQPWLFKLAVRVGGFERDLKAGEYAFPAGVTPNEVIATVIDGKSLARRLTVIEGQTVKEVLSALDRAEGLVGELPETLAEGTLLPETYLYSQGDTKTAMVGRMQAAMAEVLKDAWENREPDLPFDSPDEALIMASIVDRETAVAEERFEVAAVFVNRLRLGMKLQSDPTIIYGLTQGAGVLDRELTREDWKLDDPYNTYRIEGLPPGPIGNPGRESIEAVMHPATVDYLFFVADGTGGHAFAVTLDEHNKNVARWRRIKAGEEPAPVSPAPRRPEEDLSSSSPAAPSPGNAETTDPSTPAAAPQTEGSLDKDEAEMRS